MLCSRLESNQDFQLAPRPCVGAQATPTFRLCVGSRGLRPILPECLCSRLESNQDFQLRRLASYPLNDGGVLKMSNFSRQSTGSRISSG